MKRTLGLSSAERVRLLRRRALRFLEDARRALQDGFYAEQAAQLYAKALLLELAGYVPTTHDVRDILGLIGETLPEDLKQRLHAFSREHRHELAELTDIYTNARYGPRALTQEEATATLEVVEELLSLLDAVREEVRGVEQPG